MRPSSRYAFLAIVVLIVLTGAGSAQCKPDTPGETQAKNSGVHLAITGRLFGYYRISYNPRDTKPPNPQDKLEPVCLFLSYLQSLPNDHLLLGMGDNFGPEFGARLQGQQKEGDPCFLPVDSKSSSPAPENLFKSDLRMVAKAHCDSVANFLELAGYRALVPGREDFLSGAGWLHNIAALLKQDKKSAHEMSPAEDKMPVMLGANLRLRADKPSPQLDSAWVPCGLLFGDYQENALIPQCSKLGGDSAGPSSVVPEKLRLLQELDAWIKEPDRFNEETGLKGKSVQETDRFQLYEITTRRQLLIHDMLEILWLGMPDCSHYGTLDLTNSLALRLQSQIGPLLRDHKDGELSAITDRYDDRLATPEWASLMPSNERKLALSGLCGFEAGKPSERVAADQFAQQWGEFAGFVACSLQREAIFEKQIRNAPENQENSQPGKAQNACGPREPATAGLFDPANLDKLAQARKAILRAIANDHFNAGFTEATVLTPGGDKTVLIVGVVGIETMQAIQDTNLSLTLGPNEASILQSSGTQIKSQATKRTGKDDPKAQGTKFKVEVADPLETVEMVVRAARERHGRPYDLTILMAQMPHTEAEELIARVRADAWQPDDKSATNDAGTGKPIQDPPWIDLVISEAQQDHATQSVDFSYTLAPSDRVPSVTPVVTPHPAYDTRKQGLVEPIMKADVALLPNRKVHISSLAGDIGATTQSTMSLLADQLPDGLKYPKGICASASGSTRDQCSLEMMRTILALLAARHGADVVALERRDLFLGKLPESYDGYEMCEPPMQPGQLQGQAKKDCYLRVALARVLWQGDDFSRIMVSGKDLGGALAKAETYSKKGSSLTTTDIYQQWLQTTGIVTPVSDAPPLTSTGFSVQSSPECHDPEEEAKPSAGSGSRMYCVNGLPLQPDHGYWVVTSRHLATEKQEYGLSGQNPADYLEPPAQARNGIGAVPVKNSNNMVDAIVTASSQITVSTIDVREMELHKQQEKIFHVDIGKVVAGFNFQRPIGGSANIINRFQGVSDATASSAGSANLDLEQKQRLVWEFRSVAVGLQNDAEFDRQVQDNLTGKFVNGNFTKNSLSAGPFLQLQLPFRFTPLQKGEGRRWFRDQHPAKAIPRWTLVFAPAQGLTQLAGSHLNFSAASGASQISLIARRTYGIGERAGIRHEFDGGNWKRWRWPSKGSYFETGGQFVQQRNVLSSLTFTIPGLPPVVCSANGSQSFGNCAPSSKVLTADSTVTGQYGSTDQWGWYWDMHYQWGLFEKTYDKTTYRVTLTMDSKGDFFSNRGPNHAFSTQTWYDAPGSVALVFPVLRNLGFAPTYTAYFYGNQVAQNSLLVNTFSVNLRWYIDRDSHVPVFWRSFLFKGPATADETQSGKSK